MRVPIARPSQLVGAATPQAEWLSGTLPHAAADCFELFCDVERIPEWLPMVRSAIVQRRDGKARPREVAFLTRVGRATLGYTCNYRYLGDERRVSWSTPPGSSIRVAGLAQFAPLGEKACMMTYWLDLSHGEGLASHVAALDAGHAASDAMNDFREFAARNLGR